MKTLSLTLLALLAFAFNCSAEIIVYTNVLTVTISGDHTSTTRAVAGYTLIDSDTGDITQVLAYTKLKQFAVWDVMDTVRIDQIRTPTTTNTVITQSSYWVDDEDYEHTDVVTSEGKNVTITINGVRFTIPKTFAWTGRNLYPSLTGDTFHEKWSGKINYSPKWTATCNSAGDSFQTAVDRIRQFYFLKGYTEQ